jgi:hypothetical protein
MISAIQAHLRFAGGICYSELSDLLLIADRSYDETVKEWI